MKEEQNNNIVKVSGYLSKEPEYSHEVMGEKYYTAELVVKRKSNNADCIPLLIPDVLAEELELSEYIKIEGQFRSYNKRTEDGKSQLILSVFAQQVERVHPFNEPADDDNSIELTGYICKEPTYRKTPLGRDICDVLLAVHRAYGKSDYLPGITWGRNALRTSRMQVGDKVKVKGRIQSREHEKKLENETTVIKTVYEVSASLIEQIDKE